jgi:8-oxo-dGTP pyrophosphatase MutT (NUDIX family)
VGATPVHATRRLSPELVEYARSFLAGERRAVPPRPAATVILLRDADAGPEVYLLRRHRRMAFAAGMYAFPGGTVDPRDADADVAWAGPEPATWAAVLACDEREARALVCAAVRETFEESGVLFAGTSASSIVSDTTGEGWEQDRGALVDRSLAFGELLDRRGLVLRSDLLVAWAHWITPEFEPRRYDTRFFLATMPAGQRTRDVSGEADTVTWMSPAAAVAGVDDGDMAMLPPTYVTVKELAAYTSSDKAWAAGIGRRITTIIPGVELEGGEGFLTLDESVLP